MLLSTDVDGGGYASVLHGIGQAPRIFGRMAETNWAALRGLLAERYEELKGRLTRWLGSEELASESLHETWLRLHRAGNAGVIESPPAYLLRVAFNIARDRLRADNRRVRRSEIDALLGIPDPAPGPDRAAEARLELELLERAIRDLPERSRAILLASRVEGLTHRQIADRLDISKRLVQYELERAVQALEERIEKGHGKLARSSRQERLNRNDAREGDKLD
jgi:RNA polymerase sigma factor (sigma-70 family)